MEIRYNEPLSVHANYPQEEHNYQHTPPKKPKYSSTDLAIRSQYNRLFPSHHHDGQHLKSRKFMCQICSYDCGSLNNYYFHLESHTLKELKEFGKYECSHCSLSFVDFNDLMVHLQTEMNKEKTNTYVCQNCNYRCNSLYDYSKHQDTHNHVVPSKIRAESIQQCQLCKLMVPNLKQLKLHLKTVHKITEKDDCCPVCYELFASDKILMAHVRIHGIINPFICYFCYQAFPDNKNYKKHIKFHNTNDLISTNNTIIHTSNVTIKSDEGLKCSYCELSFPSTRSLNIHTKKHTEERPFQCPDCPKAFVTENNLFKHSSMHSGIKPYKCEICEKSFNQQSSLSFHRRLHFREKIFKCEYCDKEFAIADHYNRHIRVHTKEKPYKCNICEKSFSQSNTLTQHIRIHTGEKPYVCRVCGKAFKVQDHLSKHMRTHTGEKPYKCSFCDKCFTQQTGLKQHYKKHDT